LRLRYSDGREISVRVADSNPLVNNWMVWTEPPQGTFLCAEPMISGALIEPGQTAELNVLISVNRLLRAELKA
jgi:hypothetical protein